MPFADNIAIEQEIIVATLQWHLLYSHAPDLHQDTFNRGRVAILLFDTDFRSWPSAKISRI